MKPARVAAYLTCLLCLHTAAASSLYGLERDRAHFHPGMADYAELDSCLAGRGKFASSPSEEVRPQEDVQAIAARRVQFCLRPLLARMRATAGNEAQEIDEEELLDEYAQQRAESLIRQPVPVRAR